MKISALIGLYSSSGCTTITGPNETSAEDADDQSSTSTDSAYARDTGTKSKDEGMIASIVDSKADPEGYGLEFDIELRERDMRGTRPVAVEISIHNRSDTGYRLYTGAWTVFPAAPSDEATPGLRLLPSEHELYQEINRDACWSIETTGTVLLREAMPAYDAGESERREYSVIGVSEHFDGDCPDPGEYRFSHTYDIWEQEVFERDDIDPHDEENYDSFEWGFTLELS